MNMRAVCTRAKPADKLVRNLLAVVLPFFVGLGLAACEAPEDPNTQPTYGELVEVCQGTASCVVSSCEGEREAMLSLKDEEPNAADDPAGWDSWNEAYLPVAATYRSCTETCSPDLAAGAVDSVCNMDGLWLECAAAQGRQLAWDGDPLEVCEMSFDGYPWN